MHESHKIPHLQDFVGTVHTGPATRRLESPSTRSLRPPQCPISALSPLERLREVAATDPSTLPQRAIQGATFMTAGRQKIIARPAPRSRSRERCLRRDWPRAYPSRHLRQCHQSHLLDGGLGQTWIDEGLLDGNLALEARVPCAPDARHGDTSKLAAQLIWSDVACFCPLHCHPPAKASLAAQHGAA